MGVWRFDRRVNLEAKAYTVAELCAFLTKQTEGRPRVTVEGAMADERISFKEKEMYIWDVLEKVYEEKGGRFEEREKDMLVLRRGEK